MQDGPAAEERTVSYAKRVVDRIGGARAIEDLDGRFDHRPSGVAEPKLPGVYVLFRAGEPVFIGKAPNPEEAIEIRRIGLSFIPKIEFDKVEIFREHPDRIASRFAELKRIYDL